MCVTTRILFAFCFGSHGQCILLAVGYSTSHDHRRLRGDRGYPFWDFKAGALG